MLMPCVAFLLALQLFIGAVVSWKDGVWDDALLNRSAGSKRGAIFCVWHQVS